MQFMQLMQLDPRLAGVAATQWGLFTTAQAIAAGYSELEIKRHLRAEVWTRLRRGIYIETCLLPAGEAERHVVMTRAVLLRVGGGAFASHVTAAAVHGLVLLEPDLSLVHITVPGLKSSRTEAGVHYHAAVVPPGRVQNVLGVPVTDIAWTIVDMARESTFEQGVVTAEGALWRAQTTSDSLRFVLLHCLDWAGARNAGRVVSFASNGSESPGESLGRIAFEQHGLPAPQQQMRIHDRRGFIARVDYLWLLFRTIGEFDGRSKYEGDATSETLYAEKRREDRLRDAGFEVVRFGWSDVRSQSAALAARVRAAFARGIQREALDVDALTREAGSRAV
jgi:very-short-patch-repair endonuclease